MSSQILAALAAVSLVGAGVAGAAETRSVDAIPGASALVGSGMGGGSDDNRCRVDVVRSGAPGTADITRQVLNNGGCVCIVTTGQAASNGSAEDIVKALLRDRTCDGAPAAAVANNGVGQAVSTAATGGGGSGAVLPVLLGAVAAGGLAVAAGKDSKG